LLFFGSQTEQIRDAIPYVLIAAAPVIGQYFGKSLSVNFLVVSGITVSLVASFLTFIDWISRRGATDILGKAGLSSAVLPALGLALSIWMSLYASGWKRLFFTFAASAILVFMLATGNRTNYVLFFALIPLAFKSDLFRRHRGALRLAPARNSTFLLLFSLILFAGMAFIFISNLGLGSFLQERLINFSQIFLNNATNDQSYVLRAIYYQLGFDTFIQSPLFGSGFNPFGDTRVQDTPFEGLAKIGIFGSATFAIGMLSMVRAGSRLPESFAALKSAFVGWLLVLLALSPFGTIWQDKGLAIAIVYVVALTQSGNQDREILSLSHEEIFLTVKPKHDEI
jgi:hypothetical protein